MNPRHCHLNLDRESRQAFELLAYRAPDLRKKWRTLMLHTVCLGLGLGFMIVGVWACFQ